LPDNSVETSQHLSLFQLNCQRRFRSRPSATYLLPWGGHSARRGQKGHFTNAGARKAPPAQGRIPEHDRDPPRRPQSPLSPAISLSAQRLTTLWTLRCASRPGSPRACPTCRRRRGPPRRRAPTHVQRCSLRLSASPRLPCSPLPAARSEQRAA